ncbi:hypothetical protein ACFWGM_05005 [Streptomyces roseolus]|uniref:hypothetical protein n=1 Tax=Streptomyces roseolus TaxID=67358 RepID=UPI00362CE918
MVLAGRPATSGQHAWDWYRKTGRLPTIPIHPAKPSGKPSDRPDRTLPPPPAPGTEQLLALIEDAAVQARKFLGRKASLECAWEEDAVRLTSRIPHLRIPDIAERLGLDVADLRHRIATEGLSV